MIEALLGSKGCGSPRFLIFHGYGKVPLRQPPMSWLDQQGDGSYRNTGSCRHTTGLPKSVLPALDGCSSPGFQALHWVSGGSFTYFFNIPPFLQGTQYGIHSSKLRGGASEKGRNLG